MDIGTSSFRDWACTRRRAAKGRRLSIVLTFVFGLSLILPGGCYAASSRVSAMPSTASLELYATFQSMGIVVSFDPGDDLDRSAVAHVEYRIQGTADPYRQGYPLTRVDDSRFVGSLFWLEPGTTYEVRVLCSDPDEGPLDGIVLTGTASTRAEADIPLPDRSLYVGPTGSGSTCALTVPCTLPEALNQARSGDEIVLTGGIYYVGELALPRSGVAGAPIVIRGREGETAVLDGADPATPEWTVYGRGVYHTTLARADTHLVVAGGERLYPYQSLSDLEELRWGIPGFYADGMDLYVHLESDADPSSASVIISRYHHAFDVTQDFVCFVDLVFRYYGQGDAAKAINLSDASDNLVQGCTFAINDTGIVIKGESHRNVIEDNEFYDTVFAWPWDAVKAEGRLETGGVRFGSVTTGQGNVIRRNRFHDYFDGAKICPQETAGPTNETDFYGNSISYAGDDGIETDGQCSNVRIWRNSFHDVLVGISLAPVYVGPVYVIRNTVYRTGVGNNDYSGGSLKFSSGSERSGPMYLFHNTVDASLPGANGLTLGEPGSWDLVYGRNNIWSGTAIALRNRNAAQPVDLDYDDLWSGASHDLVRWDDASYTNLAEFTGATGQESHGLGIEPGFVAAESGDYSLSPASALIDAGVLLPGINDSYAGGAPDIGAFESGEPRSITQRMRASVFVGCSGHLLTSRLLGPRLCVR